jgi:hypothetical protein
MEDTYIEKMTVLKAYIIWSKDPLTFQSALTRKKLVLEAYMRIHSSVYMNFKRIK